jgi:hypothetical protein
MSNNKNREVVTQDRRELRRGRGRKPGGQMAAMRLPLDFSSGREVLPNLPAARRSDERCREPPLDCETRLAVIYRYVLHLDCAESRRTLRWMFAHPVLEHEEIELPMFGRWYVSRAVTDEGPTAAGVLYCTPAI